MRITKYGQSVVLQVVAGAVMISIGILFFHVSPPVKAVAIALSFLFAGFTLLFFRDPERKCPLGVADGHGVISPADGKIVALRETEEPDYLQRPAWLVSIFMSPVNVHVNRIPISGTVGYLRYVPGDYLIAFDEKSSERNERMLIGIEGDRSRVLFRQIAGFVARRIVCALKPGQTVTAGERFGMIKFGSRVDIFFPKSYTPVVNLHDSVRAGETMLALSAPQMSNQQ